MIVYTAETLKIGDKIKIRDPQYFQSWIDIVNKVGWMEIEKIYDDYRIRVCFTEDQKKIIINILGKYDSHSYPDFIIYSGSRVEVLEQNIEEIVF